LELEGYSDISLVARRSARRVRAKYTPKPAAIPKAATTSRNRTSRRVELLPLLTKPHLPLLALEVSANRYAI
jgi:hypothetical protein